MEKTRLENLRGKLEEKSLNAIFISSIPTITYLTNFSGFDNEDRNAFLLITKDTQYIFTHGIYKEAAEKYISGFTLIDIAREQPMSSSLQSLIEKHAIKQLGFEAANITFLEYASLRKKIEKDILVPADSITETLRIVKSNEEIEKILQACKMGDAAFTYLLSEIKEDMSEKELALLYEIFVKKHGANISFDTIVAFDSNGSLPHHVPSEKRLTKNSFIVLDFGVKLDNYCSDMTRTVFFGKASNEEKKLYNTVLTAQEKAIDYIKSNYSSSEQSESRSKSSRLSSNNNADAIKADAIAREYIISQGYPDMPHSLGHGIGLLVHELPRLSPYAKETLSKGMVFSVEPGIYLPDIGGVRIEDLVALTDQELLVLTNAPKNLIELS